jgi:hypothetical protein
LNSGQEALVSGSKMMLIDTEIDVEENAKSIGMADGVMIIDTFTVFRDIALGEVISVVAIDESNHSWKW